MRHGEGCYGDSSVKYETSGVIGSEWRVELGRCAVHCAARGLISVSMTD